MTAMAMLMRAANARQAQQDVLMAAARVNAQNLSVTRMGAASRVKAAFAQTVYRVLLHHVKTIWFALL